MCSVVGHMLVLTNRRVSCFSRLVTLALVGVFLGDRSGAGALAGDDTVDEHGQPRSTIAANARLGLVGRVAGAPA